MYPLLIFGLLFATWLVLSGLFDVFHISLGLISSALVTWMSSDLLFEDRRLRIADRIARIPHIISYTTWLMKQVVLSNINMLRFAFSPSKIDPVMVCFKTELKTDFSRFILAQSITLTPGTVTVKILGDEFYVHAIEPQKKGRIGAQMERRIARIFEPQNPYFLDEAILAAEIEAMS